MPLCDKCWQWDCICEWELWKEAESSEEEGANGEDGVEMEVLDEGNAANEGDRERLRYYFGSTWREKRCDCGKFEAICDVKQGMISCRNCGVSWNYWEPGWHTTMYQGKKIVDDWTGAQCGSAESVSRYDRKYYVDLFMDSLRGYMPPLSARARRVFDRELTGESSVWMVKQVCKRNGLVHYYPRAYAVYYHWHGVRSPFQWTSEQVWGIRESLLMFGRVFDRLRGVQFKRKKMIDMEYLIWRILRSVGWYRMSSYLCLPREKTLCAIEEIYESVVKWMREKEGVQRFPTAYHMRGFEDMVKESARPSVVIAGPGVHVSERSHTERTPARFVEGLKRLGNAGAKKEILMLYGKVWDEKAERRRNSGFVL